MKRNRLLEIIQDEISSILKEGEMEDKAAKAAQIKAIDLKIKALQNEKIALMKNGLSETSIQEDQLDEMAKITGRLESAIKDIIAKNPELEGLALKKVIRKDEEVLDALEGDDLYDNQLNKFIALVKGQRELGQRGRKPSEDKPETTPKPKPAVSPKPTPSTDPKPSTSTDEDPTVIDKALNKDIPKETIERFNLGLKFIKKFKDDKAKIDAYLRKAETEYKFSKDMIKDLKKAAGRDVKI